MKQITLILALTAILVVSGCKDQSAGVTDSNKGTISLFFGKAPASIAQIVARLTRPGFDDRVLTLTIADTGKSASGSINDVAVGTWHLKVDAVDDSGHVKYTGEADVDVLPGQLTQVSLELSATTGSVEIVVTWGGSCTPAPTGLVSWWSADGNADDRVGSNDGDLIDSISFSRGKVGKAFNLNGTDQYVRIHGSPSLNPTGSFSIDAWIYPTSDVRYGNIIGRWGDSYEWLNQRSWWFGIGRGMSLQFSLSDTMHQNDSTFHQFGTRGGVVLLNQWNHVAAVFDKVNHLRQLYVDGVKVGEKVDSAFNVAGSYADVAIGASLYSPFGSTFYFPGRIDEIDFFDKALTENEVKLIFAAGSVGKCR